MTSLEKLARKPAAYLSAHREGDWRRLVPLAQNPPGSPFDGHGEDAGGTLRSGDPDAGFLRRILFGLVAAASLTGAVTVALWAQTHNHVAVTFDLRSRSV
jgi:hypothetical protein